MKLLIITIFLIQYNYSLKMDVCEEIKNIDDTYEKVLILNSVIKNTDTFNISQYMIKHKEYHKILEERQILLNKFYEERKLQPEIYKHHRVPTIVEKQISELNIKMRDIKIDTDNVMINNIYSAYFVNDEIYMQSMDNIDIKLYKIVRLNLEKKKELAIIMDEYKSIDNIKLMLQDLYQKQIDSYNITSI